MNELNGSGMRYNGSDMRQGRVPQFPGQPQHRERLMVAQESDFKVLSFLALLVQKYTY
jgi:hypothetical protein